MLSIAPTLMHALPKPHLLKLWELVLMGNAVPLDFVQRPHRKQHSLKGYSQCFWKKKYFLEA